MLSSFCCGCTLKTGSYITGWYFTILGAIRVVFKLYYIYVIVSLTENIISKEQKFLTTCFLILYLVFELIQIAAQILLLIGTKKKLTAFLKTWVIFMVIVTAYRFLNNIHFLITGDADYKLLERKIIQLLSGFALNAISVYFIMVVSAHHVQLLNSPKPQSNPEAPPHQPQQPISPPA